MPQPLLNLNQAAIRSFFGIGGGLPTGGIGTFDVEHLAALGERVAIHARSILSARVTMRTNQLLNSIKSEVLTDELGPYAKISASATVVRPSGTWNYASMIERGTDPHPITAVNAGVLRSAPGHPDPLTHPVKSVNHPGTYGRKFLEDALEVVRFG